MWCTFKHRIQKRRLTPLLVSVGGGSGPEGRQEEEIVRPVILVLASIAMELTQVYQVILCSAWSALEEK